MTPDSEAVRKTRVRFPPPRQGGGGEPEPDLSGGGPSPSSARAPAAAGTGAVASVAREHRTQEIEGVLGWGPSCRPRGKEGTLFRGHPTKAACFFYDLGVQDVETCLCPQAPEIFGIRSRCSLRASRGASSNPSVERCNPVSLLLAPCSWRGAHEYITPRFKLFRVNCLFSSLGVLCEDFLNLLFWRPCANGDRIHVQRIHVAAQSFENNKTLSGWLGFLRCSFTNKAPCIEILSRYRLYEAASICLPHFGEDVSDQLIYAL